MKCPHCEIPLMMAERKGVEIDFCPQCRGVWLDKGELDKIIDLSAQEREATVQPHTGAPRGSDYVGKAYSGKPYGGPTEHSSGHRPEYHSPYGRKHKKKSLMGEIFDIFG